MNVAHHVSWEVSEQVYSFPVIMYLFSHNLNYINKPNLVIMSPPPEIPQFSIESVNSILLQRW